MFDPERIRRWRPLGDEIMLDTVPGNEDAPRDSEFVLASDYDALLKLYRVKEQRLLDLATLFGVCDGGRYLEDWKTKAALLKQ